VIFAHGLAPDSLLVKKLPRSLSTKPETASLLFDLLLCNIRYVIIGGKATVLSHYDPARSVPTKTQVTAKDRPHG